MGRRFRRQQLALSKWREKALLSSWKVLEMDQSRLALTMVNIGIWNVRGMNSHTKQLEINRMLSQNNVGLFGLLETRIKRSSMHNNVFTADGKWSVVTNYNHHNGGRIWMIWDHNLFELDEFSTFSQCIHVKVSDKIRKQTFWLTIVYGMNKASERADLWQQIGHIRQRSRGAWCMMGDFNAISNFNDRLGGNSVSNADIQSMGKMIEECEIEDLKAKGAYFTWNNKQAGDRVVYSIIDRVLINE